ncbi:Emopamil-binding protein [Morchella conica CCBAS932]|uniref:Emopamil-binding protein n=1 Tax=Morchella conica CCBAS932 TaxID=1392247 RepID=A0A3N4L7Q4_9PEZI|nr:Emopamil-binding protein [Morchella conica CCBAS932]
MHPYNPPELFLPDFIANDASSIRLCATFGSVLAAVVGSHLMLWGGHLSSKDKGITSWFLVCGLLHVFFEGYFLVHHATLSTRTDFPAQLWKEYSLSDSRYLSGDKFVLAIESITIILWGPLCLLTSRAIVKESYYRHPLQLLASLAHIYGCLMYFATSWLDGNRHCRPEPFYFYVYYIGMNVPWIIIPGLLINQSFTYISSSLKKLHDMEAR